MRQWWSMLVLACAGCAASSPPSLSPTAALESGAKSSPGVESTLIVAGTPTEVYALVARAALKCWLGADGPLKGTHVFNADAASPTQGGAAMIVLQERDQSFSDQRGARAFRVSFVGESQGVRVGITNLRMPDAIGQLMVRDAETWARGGEGCEARSLQTSHPLKADQRNSQR